MKNGYDAYRRQSITTMTPGEMLNTIYDALLKELYLARGAYQEHNNAQINASLQKAQRLVEYLRGTLNPEYEVSQSLDALYDYFLQVLVQSNVRKDPAGLPEVIQMVTELKESFVQADKTTRTQGA